MFQFSIHFRDLSTARSNICQGIFAPWSILLWISQGTRARKRQRGERLKIQRRQLTLVPTAGYSNQKGIYRSRSCGPVRPTSPPQQPLTLSKHHSRHRTPHLQTHLHPPSFPYGRPFPTHGRVPPLITPQTSPTEDTRVAPTPSADATDARHLEIPVVLRRMPSSTAPCRPGPCLCYE